MSEPILLEGETCWRIERASRLALIVDADAYFLALRGAMLKARRTIYLIGWDFDLRILMRPEEGDTADDGRPNRLGDFIRAIAKDTPELDVRILKWDGAMLAAISSQIGPTLAMEWFSGDSIHFALDSHHPAGACHHQKIVVIDDEVAFCGGIDVTTDRWDTPEHVPDDPRRTRPNGEHYPPWHDVTTALEGPAAKALGDLARERWRDATGDTLDEPASGDGSNWPNSLDANLSDVEVGIARTKPRYHGEPLVNEIERLYLAAIASAQDVIYLESQYFAAGSLCEAIERRLCEPDGPEVVIVNPRASRGFLEDEAMNSVRSRMISRLREADERRGGRRRFAIYHPVNASGVPIYVHAKVLTVDDRVLRVGSSNIDNRSLGFDTECDVALEAFKDAERLCIRRFRLSLLAEHMDREADEVASAWDREGSLIGAIAVLNRSQGRGLRAIEAEPLDPLERTLADTRLLDPRQRPRPRQRVEHAMKRGMAPYHTEVVSVGTVLSTVAVVGLGVFAARYLAQRFRERTHRSSKFPTPAIIVRRDEARHRVRPS